MFAPDGTLGDIPAEKLMAAKAAGFKQGVTMKTADGKLGVIPADRVPAAAKSGLQIVPLQEQETQHAGFWASLGSDIKDMMKGAATAAATVLSSDPNDIAYRMNQQAQTAKQMSANDDARKAEGRGIPYRVGAAANEALGVNVKGEEQSAKEGDAMGVLGHASAVPVTMAATAGAAKGARVTSAAVKQVASQISDSISPRLYRSALKPSTTLSPAESASIVQTGIENKIPVSEAGQEKLSNLITDLNGKIKAQIQAGSNAGKTVNARAVASRLPETAAKFANQVNPEADIAAVRASRDEFLANQPAEIPADKAQELKQGTYAQLKGRSYGELKSATVEAQKALARGIKEELNSQFPELNEANARLSKLYGLDEALDRAVARTQNHNIIGLGTPTAAAAGGILTGSGAGAVVGAVLKSVIDDPVFKSKLSIALSSAKNTPLPTVRARLAAYSSALGATSRPASGQPNE